MGLDQDFVRVKKKRKFKNGEYFAYYDVEKEKPEEMLSLRKDYDLHDIMEEVCGYEYGCVDYIVINHNTYKTVIKKYQHLMATEENQEEKWYKYRILQSLEIIDKLLDFKKYSLLYSEIS